MKNYVKTAVQPKYRRLLLAFGLFIYFYLEAELLFTNRIAGSMGENTGTIFYGIFCLAAAVGFFFFSLLHRLTPTKSIRHVILALGGTGVVSTVAANFIESWPLAAVTLIAMLTAGIFGAHLLYTMAVNVEEKSVTGLVVALPYVLAFVVQYILSFVIPLFGGNGSLFQHIILAAALCAAFVLAPEHKKEPAQKQEPDVKTKAEAKRYLIGALIACFIISCLYGLVDGIIMTLHAGQELNVYGWVRLLCVPGLLFAGWTMDFKEGRYFPFCSLAAFLVLVIALFLFNTAETFSAALGSVYLLASYMTMYSLGVFVRDAGRSDNPSFWASAGRGVKYLTGGIFALLGRFVFSYFSLLVFALLYLIMLVALFAVFFFQGKLHPQDDAAATGSELPLDELALGYGFTEREVEVLKLLLDGQTTVIIAEKMSITAHSVQNHISSMMSKSYSDSRSVLITKFTGYKN